MKTPEYTSGSCNIGGPEVRRRKVSGIIGAVLAGAFYVACISFNAPKGVRAIIFFPLVLAWTGWLQSRRKFCVAFGLMGVFNFGNLGATTQIEDRENRARDRKLALVILGQAVALSVVATLFFTLVPA